LGDPSELNSLSISNGIHIQVHNKTQKPLFFKGLNAPIGSETHVVVGREFTYRLEKPYSECIKDIDSSYDSLFVKTLLNTSYAYQQVDCFNICFQRYLIEQCNCYDLTYPIWSGNYQPCLTYAQLVCDRDATSSFFVKDVKALCSKECPLECDSIAYKSSMSFLEFPSQAYANILSRNAVIQAKFGNTTNVTYDMLRRNIASVFVYYEDLSYKSYVESEKMNLADLISQIGGTFGLFLGLSFLSFIEIIDLIFHIFLAFLKHRQSQVSDIK
jgi:hypothetical protein